VVSRNDQCWESGRHAMYINEQLARLHAILLLPQMLSQDCPATVGGCQRGTLSTREFGENLMNYHSRH
jgi:hypothetical protein